MPSPRESEYDVIVVGLGPGGEFAANKLARAGLSVLAVDKHLVGGECPFYGCVPSKMMIRAADHAHESGDLDFGPVAARIRDEATHDWTDDDRVERLEESGATVVRGVGLLVGLRTIEIDGHRYAARRGVVLATGTDPGAPPIEGLDATPYWTNRDIVKVTEAPASLAVLGAGPIGCELAQVFARFGSQVSLVEVAERIMTVEEPESSALMTKVLRREGLEVFTGATIDRVSYDGRFTLHGPTPVTVDRLLVSAGRDPHLRTLGLAAVGVDDTGKAVDVDGALRVLDRDGQPVDGLFAVGDIVGKGLFTHTAKQQAVVAMRALTGDPGEPLETHALPRVTFTSPEVGSVGLTEQQARDQGLDVRVGLADLTESSRGHTHGSGADGLIKVVAVDGVLVGATSIGPAGGEVLSMLTLAVHARIPVEVLRTMVYPFPTWHESVRAALGDL